MSFLFGGRKSTSAPDQAAVPRFSSTGPDGGSSLELIRYDTTTGKFSLGDEALKVLKQTRGPVGVVAVAGRARQGKSFILNQLLGHSGGFKVAATHRPCTKGLWMWSAPVELQGADGSKYNLVLLDTEGIDAYDQTAQYSTQIFSLAVLLSSLFVYNQLGPIDEAALDRLSLVTEMTKNIRVRASSGAAEDASELAAFTPAFIWLLRDFYLKLEEDGVAVSPRDYLEAALQAHAGSGPAVAAKNQVRNSIKALFPDRDCFTLVRPVNDEDALARLDSLPPSALRPEFKDGLSRLTRLVFSKAQPKRLGAQVLTGPLLAGLAEAYVTSINAGAVPTIATAWQGVAESECRRAADESEAAYAAAFPDNIPANEAELEATHRRAMTEAQHAFEGIAIGEESIKKANERRWKDACEARYNDLKQRKLATAALACERAINEASARLAAVVRREGATLDDLRKEATAFEAAYGESTEVSGPTKWPRFAQFMRETYGGAMRDLAERQEQAQRAAAAQAAAQAQQAATRAAAAEQEVVSLRTRVAEAERALTQERQALVMERQRVAALEAQLQQLTTSHTSDRARIAQEAEERARAGSLVLQSQLTFTQSELETLRRQAAASITETRGMADRLSALAAERDQAQAGLRDVSTGRAAAERRVGELQTELAAMQQRHEVALADAARRAVVVDENRPRPPAVNTRGVPTTDDVEMYSSPRGGEDFNEEGGDGGLEVPPTAVSVNTAKMTINDMKAWLMDHGKEAEVWEMSSKKAKKAEWEAVIKRMTSV